MFRIAFTLGLLAFFGWLLVDAAQRDGERRDRLERIAEQSGISPTEARIAEAMQDMIFFRETRTGFCFARAWGGAGNGGPMAAHVPCNGNVKYIPFTAGAE